jgi:hypothetical protein
LLFVLYRTEGRKRKRAKGEEERGGRKRERKKTRGRRNK